MKEYNTKAGQGAALVEGCVADSAGGDNDNQHKEKDYTEVDVDELLDRLGIVTPADSDDDRKQVKEEPGMKVQRRLPPVRSMAEPTPPVEQQRSADLRPSVKIQVNAGTSGVNRDADASTARVAIEDGTTNKDGLVKTPQPCAATAVEEEKAPLTALSRASTPIASSSPGAYALNGVNRRNNEHASSAFLSVVADAEEPMEPFEHMQNHCGLVEALAIGELSEHMIHGEAEPVPLDNDRNNKNTTHAYSVGVMVFWGFLCLGFIGLVLGLSLRHSNSHGPSVEETLAESPTSSSTVAPEFLIQGLPDFTTQVLIEDRVKNTVSPQTLAYQWLIRDPNFDSYSPERQLQRLALATFYYSTHGDKWNKGSAALDQSNATNLVLTKPFRPPPIPGMNEPSGPPLEGNVTKNTAPWLSYTVHECLWYNDNYRDFDRKDYNTCTWKDKYQVLIIKDNNLAGTLPPELALLTELTMLALRRNGGIAGKIPTEYGLLTKLQSIDFEGNQITGLVLTEIGQWTNLRSLRMHRNRLTSTIPSEIMQLSLLYEIMLGDNQFSGSIPAGSFSTSLLKLELYGNQLTGPLPTELGLLTEMRVLELAANQFTGWIPTELGLLHRLWNLQLEFNQFSGPLPSELGQLSALDSLTVGGNQQLTGTIPKELGPLAISLSVVTGGGGGGNQSQSTGEAFGDGSATATSPQNRTDPPKNDGFPQGLGMNVEMNATNGTVMDVNSELETSDTRPGQYSQGPGGGNENGPRPPQPNMTNEELDIAVSLLRLEIQGTSISGVIPRDLCDIRELEFDCSESLCGCDCVCP